MMATLSSYSDSTTMLSHRYEELLSSRKFSDCTFTVDQTTINCHKLILAAASPVFEAMLYGPMPEKNSIDILDISPEVFLLMIKYIYVGEIVDINGENVQNLIELYYGAEKYMLPDLAMFCLNGIKSKLRFGNILPALDLSILMGLKQLIQVCNLFFSKCCMSNPQYTKELKSHYYHVSKDCMKSIITNNKDNRFLVTFMQEWCKVECKNQQLNEKQYQEVINDFGLPELMQIEGLQQTSTTEVPRKMKKCYYTTCNYAERTYYKACRPFLVSGSCCQYSACIKSSWYVHMLGVIISSRLMPKIGTSENLWEQEYCESITVEVSCKREIVHRQKFHEDKASYNCYLNIPFDVGLVLTPDEEYRITFIWGKTAYGAEYPLSLHSNRARAITFIDSDSSVCNDDGSLLKGVKYLDLV